MRQPAKPKPSAVTETARVMRIFDWLVEERAARHAAVFLTGDTLLIVAERIAARTSGDA